jgi:hypothetical protein
MAVEVQLRHTVLHYSVASDQYTYYSQCERLLDATSGQCCLGPLSTVRRLSTSLYEVQCLTLRRH